MGLLQTAPTSSSMRQILLSLLIILFVSPLYALTTGELADQEYEHISPHVHDINPKALYFGILAYENARSEGLDTKELLTIVDFSSPSNTKRLWVLDIKNNKVLYHTYVTHGTGNGFLYARRFSNNNETHESSLGLFQTKATYTGHVGYALRLNGLEDGYNNNAEKRAIVMHGAPYANADFIEHYGRLGRSWGCFAMPENIYQSVIDTVKNDTLIFAYYPDQDWLTHSRFLQNNHLRPATKE
jgi:hypothetical protein